MTSVTGTAEAELAAALRAHAVTAIRCAHVEREQAARQGQLESLPTAQELTAQLEFMERQLQVDRAGLAALNAAPAAPRSSALSDLALNILTGGSTGGSTTSPTRTISPRGSA
ncbi:hypothetical protein ABCR94_13625 [Streptomyces sp. 21So2-11]|uniref:hypothetical protein n=1 Tax=Streptomyces sp. 21So2-11 TaxID=3144408 RepID=UPI003218FA77